MSVKNNTFLFTGQLRHKKKLVRSIIELKFLFLFDEIIISTWKEELESKVLLDRFHSVIITFYSLFYSTLKLF